MFDNDILMQFRENDAFICSDGSRYKYSEILNFSQQISNSIPTRSLIFSKCTNSPGSIIGYVSFILSRSVPLLLKRDIDEEMLRNLIETYEPEYIWMPEEDFDDKVEGEVVLNFLGYSLVRFSTDGKTVMHDDLAILLTTSGSTGSPKLVKLSYKNLESNAKSIADYLSLGEEERPITTLPMNYSFGLSIINSHLTRGSTIVLTDSSLMEKSFWSLIEWSKATSLSGVPYTFEILKRLRFSSIDLPYLKTMTQAGGRLSTELHREFAELCVERGIRFFVMYGQTEATARMSYLPPEKSLEKIGSVGIAIPGGEFHLIREDGERIERIREQGELVYEGGNVSMGYATTLGDLRTGDENRGILFTGDLAERDEDGFLFIVGRKNRFIKIFGNRINLDDIEEMVRKVVPECACIGKDDKMTIFITREEMVMQVKKFISSKTKLNQSSIEVCFVEFIPKNTSGKTLYSELK